MAAATTLAAVAGLLTIARSLDWPPRRAGPTAAGHTPAGSAPSGRAAAPPLGPRGEAAPPRFQAQNLDPRSAQVGADSLAHELDAARLREAEIIDGSVRRAAFARVGLNAQEVAVAERIYREADRLWLEAERRLDPATGRLLAQGIAGLYAADRHVTLGLVRAFTGARAADIRNAERMAYRDRIRTEYRGEAEASFAARLAARRLEMQRRMVGRPAPGAMAASSSR